jgi:hypothetical protein
VSGNTKPLVSTKQKPAVAIFLGIDLRASHPHLLQAIFKNDVANLSQPVEQVKTQGAPTLRLAEFVIPLDARSEFYYISSLIDHGYTVLSKAVRKIAHYEKSPRSRV